MCVYCEWLLDLKTNFLNSLIQQILICCLLCGKHFVYIPVNIMVLHLRELLIQRGGPDLNRQPHKLYHYNHNKFREEKVQGTLKYMAWTTWGALGNGGGFHGEVTFKLRPKGNLGISPVKVWPRGGCWKWKVVDCAETLRWEEAWPVSGRNKERSDWSKEGRGRGRTAWDTAGE